MNSLCKAHGWEKKVGNRFYISSSRGIKGENITMISDESDDITMEIIILNY